MKKWIVLVSVAVICVVAISLMKIEETTRKRVIYIKGGEPVLADNVSQSDQFIFYDADGKTGMFMRDDVTSVGTIHVQHSTSLVKKIDRAKQRLLADMGVGSRVNRLADSRLLLFLVILGTAFGVTQLNRLLLTVIRRRRSAALNEGPSPAATEKTSAFSQNVEETSDYRDIALFFLELYKLQNGLPKDAPARFSMVGEAVKSKIKMFELGVKGSSDWLTRRMSIGPLGEEAGSKSKCFYVIYDTHMVVKIPPVPATDITKYVNDIRKEVQIAAHLAPIACIVPMVSVVLKKVKKLPFESSLTQEQVEKQYIRMVEENPEYQEYLKIGDRFAFFMELTNSFFLGRVISELHKSKHDIGDELRESPEVAWDQRAFTMRYGLENLAVFEGLQTLYRLCEAEVQRIVKAHGRTERIHSFQIKNWFLAGITGEGLPDENQGIDAALLSGIKEGFTTVFTANAQQVDNLIQLLKTQLAAKAFSQNRQQIENIASNVLQLLTRLKEKRIALRDLKPDNLFMDADPDNYPVFLKDSSAFSIGVIDVETAVSLIPMKDGTITQPLIGGTPLYATPLHLLKNRAIASCCGNLADALHLQDWYATIAIIFKTVTGSNLFPRAARSFPTLLKILKSGRNPSEPDESTVKAMSQRFWSAATADIKTQLVGFAEVLNQLRLEVPEAMAPSIQAELEREEACLDQAIRKHVALSPLFKSEKNRRFLLDASEDAIDKQVERWKNPTHLPEPHRRVAPQMVAFLNNLNRLKRGGMEKRRAAAGMAAPPHPVSAYQLLEAMFQIAFRAMYKSRWNAIPKPSDASDAQSAVEDDRSFVTTILNDN